MADTQSVTINDLTSDMERLLEILEETNDRARSFELKTQIQTLELAKKAAILDPLTDINNLTVMDLSKLSSSISGARKEIANIERRNEAVGTAMTLVKGALKAAGLGI